MDRLTGLEVFVAIVDQGGFSRAAQHLRMSPAMVSTHLSRLEARLGVPLLTRTTRRVELTERGRVLLGEARHILAALAAAEVSAQGSGMPGGRVRIDAPASLGLDFIVPAIPAFRKKYPNIVLDLSLGDRGVIFRPDGFDIVVRVGDVPQTDAIVQNLGQTHFVQVASPDYLAKHPKPRTPEELSTHSAIIYASAQSRDEHRWRFSRGSEIYWIRPPEAVSFNNGTAIRNAAVAGVGIAQTLHMLVADDIAAGRLVPLLEAWNSNPLPIYQLSPADRSELPAVQAVRDFLRSQINWKR